MAKLADVVQIRKHIFHEKFLEHVGTRADVVTLRKQKFLGAVKEYVFTHYLATLPDGGNMRKDNVHGTGIEYVGTLIHTCVGTLAFGFVAAPKYVAMLARVVSNCLVVGETQPFDPTWVILEKWEQIMCDQKEEREGPAKMVGIGREGCSGVIMLPFPPGNISRMLLAELREDVSKPFGHGIV